MTLNMHHNGLPSDYIISRDHVISLMWRVGQNKGIPHDLKFFAFAISAYMLRYPNNCKPSLTQLAEFMGLSLRKVNYISSNAKKCQPFLDELQIIPGKGRRASQYRPNFSYEDEITAYAERQSDKKTRHLQLVSDNRSSADVCTTNKNSMVQTCAPQDSVMVQTCALQNNNRSSAHVCTTKTVVVQTSAHNDISNDKNNITPPTPPRGEFADAKKVGDEKSKIKKNKIGKKKKVARRLSEDWVIPEDWREPIKKYVRENFGFEISDQSIDFQAEQFRDYWCSRSGKEAAKLDWKATFRNRIRAAIQGNYLDPPKSYRAGKVPDQKWYQHPKLNEVSVEFYGKVLEKYPPNGVWREELGPPPGAPQTPWTPDLTKHYSLEKYKV